MSKKTPHILVLIQDYKHLAGAIKYAFKLAHIFKAEVAIANMLSTNNKPIDFNLDQLIKQFNTNSIAYKEIELGRIENEPNNTIKLLDVVFIVSEFPSKNLSGLFKRNPIFKLLYKAKVPSFIIGEHTSLDCDLKNIIVPVDYKKETKEKMIWASYFGRFNQAVIHLIVPKEKSESILRKIKATLLFTKKMYEQFSFDYKIVKTSSKSEAIKEESYLFSEKYKSDLILLLSHGNNSWYSNYFGPREIKKYLVKKKNPILFINPLKDYYLPCS